MRTSLTFPFLFIAALFVFSCTKIEYTTLGSQLVPDVDNVNTFDTTLDVLTETILQNDDTTKLYYTDQLAVGQIANDPLFGTSNAALYFEVKPTNFSASAIANNLRDSMVANGYDSTVLCLKYTTGYGDTTQNINFQVYTIKLSDTLMRISDTIYRINRPFQTMDLVGQRSISLRSIANDSAIVNPSTTINYKTTRELRIKLFPNNFWQELLKDSTALSGDSAYRKKFAGFAIRILPPPTPGAMAYFSISDTATKLQFFYRRRNAGVIDTTYTNFYFNPNNSGYANNVSWNKGVGAQISQHLNRFDSLIYVKANPGTQVRIRIPGLENVSNRIIHRAELKTYMVPDNAFLDSQLAAPPELYLERIDTTAANKYLTIPYDLSPNESYGTCYPTTNGINYSYFGGYPYREVVNNIPMKAYFFNLSRYVQQIVTHQLTNRPLRLTANIYAQYADCYSNIPFRATSNIINYGRVRLGGGAQRGSTWPYKMRLRIIYSKI